MYTLKQATRETPSQWTAENLSSLRKVELICLCKIMGFPSSGAKDKMVSRLLELGQLRVFLSPYAVGDSPEVINKLANRLDRKTLVRLVKQAGGYVGSTKYSLSATLISWVFSCRSKGSRFLDDMRAEIRSRPKQLSILG